MFCFEDKQARESFLHQGYFDFDDFWSLPHQFVDDINYRRGGWSAVSELRISDGNQSQLYFVKRQENQLRYSLRYPFGRLTFAMEVDAIKSCQKYGLPCVDLVCWGVSKGQGNKRAVLVTRAIDYASLADIINSDPDWNSLLDLLRGCGQQLYRMHKSGFRHGALYPKHIYINQKTGLIKLIDFERARRHIGISRVIKPDLFQLLKRLDGMPGIARDALLQPYTEHHAELVQDSLQALKSR